MPYVTFSRKFGGQRSLKKKIAIKDSIIDLRGTKTIQKIVDIAAQRGFNTILVIDSAAKGTISAQQIRITRKGKELKWKYAKRKTIKV